MHQEVRRVATAVGMALLLGSAAATADDVTDAVNDALQSYQAGNLNEAAGGLEYAAQLIRQKRGGDLVSLLPAPLSGWEAGEPDTQAMGAMAMGGMVSAEREYTRDEARITVRLVTDAPMLQGMMMLFNNPALAASDGARLERISGQKALVKYDSGEQSGDVNVAIAGRILVTVEGEGVSRDDLTAYAAAVDYGQLSKL